MKVIQNNVELAADEQKLMRIKIMDTPGLMVLLCLFIICQQYLPNTNFTLL